MALQDLEKITAKTTALDDEEELFEVWNQVITEAKKTAGYNPEFNYGVYQIAKELNTFTTFGVIR